MLVKKVYISLDSDLVTTQTGDPRPSLPDKVYAGQTLKYVKLT